MTVTGPILRVLPPAADITTIVADTERQHRNLSMCVQIAFVAVETGHAHSMIDCLRMVRRTPWGRAESLAWIKWAIEQSRLVSGMIHAEG